MADSITGTMRRHLVMTMENMARGCTSKDWAGPADHQIPKVIRSDFHAFMTEVVKRVANDDDDADRIRWWLSSAMLWTAAEFHRHEEATRVMAEGRDDWEPMEPLYDDLLELLDGGGHPLILKVNRKKKDEGEGESR